MRVLVLGSGAKDNVMAWWFSKSRQTEALFIAPGNPVTESFAVNLPETDLQNKEKILEICKKNHINFVFIGTEAPLTAGVPDFLNSNGIPVFGTPGYALKIEADRKYSREFAAKYNIPIPDYHVFDKLSELEKYLNANKKKTFTIKPNNISPSRIIVNSDDKKTLLEVAEKHLQTSSVILEDHLEGLPITITLLLDEKGYLILPICSEYTKKEHGNENIITGGMGAICPIPISESIKNKIRNNIIKPTIRGMQDENLFYKGVLTFSIILQKDNPYLVDYHVRLNDPATQAFVPLIKNDIVDIMLAIQENRLSSIKLETSSNSSVAVVIASEGYPADTKTGLEIKLAHPKYTTSHIEELPYIFYGPVSFDKQKKTTVNTGGRVCTVVGVSDNIMNANFKAYSVLENCDYNGFWYREDIGKKFFISMAE